ncbi:hypothetical protein HY969_04465 [Candidatus Kaiserbacteria bacterium]|nr:hypothetical protein [Candidatus Kaiserbacteria bacterium]
MGSLMLPQLLGLYFLIIGVIVVARRASVMPAISQLAANRPLMLVIGLAELLAGLAIVITSARVAFSVEGAIALIGWILIIEGVLYVAMPAKAVQRFVKSFNKQEWYVSGGLVSIVLGAYLAGAGFGMF